MTRVAMVMLALLVAVSAEGAQARAPKAKAADTKVKAKDAKVKTKDAKAALTAVLDVERQSKAYYGAVLAKHRPIHPFGWIYRSEREHEQALLGELERQSIDAPADRWAGETMKVPADKEEATAKAVAMEKKTVAAYDAALKVTKDAAARQTLERLRKESVDHQKWFADPDSCPMGGGGGGGRGRGPGGGRGGPPSGK